MDGNPYARIVSVIRGENETDTSATEGLQSGLGAAPARMRLGKVAQRVPLKISVAGTTQPTEALRINERMVKDAKWKVKVESPTSDYKGLSGQLQGPVTCPGGQGSPQLGSVTGGELRSTDTTIDKATATQLEIDLDVGDEVLLLTEDDQIFYILMKVVKAV